VSDRKPKAPPYRQSLEHWKPGDNARAATAARLAEARANSSDGFLNKTPFVLSYDRPKARE
jgi:hypothetical protein